MMLNLKNKNKRSIMGFSAIKIVFELCENLTTVSSTWLLKQFV